MRQYRSSVPRTSLTGWQNGGVSAQPRQHVFLLSPAHCGGRRATILTSPRAQSPLAHRLKTGEASLGEVFSFLSGLYFRGKLAYASRFASTGPGGPAVFVITPTRGLQRPETSVSIELLREFADLDLASAGERYLRPLASDVSSLAASLTGDARVVLLGSIATAKYLEPLSAVLGDRLLFPSAFIGRGDMSRGALLLRSAAESEELPYVAFSSGVERHGPRPPPLTGPQRRRTIVLERWPPASDTRKQP